MKVAGTGLLAACVLIFVGVAMSASSYSDTIGDANVAPDITSVIVAEPLAGSLQVAVTVANFQTLPPNSWVNLWFDLDRDSQTGDGGDEALIRYFADDRVEFYLWNGARLVQSPTADINASFGAGGMTLSVPRAALGAASSFGILAVAGRGQDFGSDELIASDYAPDSDRSAYVGPAPASFPDPVNDHDAAPDVTAVRVTDAKDGWVSFAITTPNLATLADDSLVVLTIDADNRRGPGELGADIRVASVGRKLEFERWLPASKSWGQDKVPTRVRLRNSGGVVTFDVHRDELGSNSRLRFAILTADLNSSADEVVAYDRAPNEALFFAYTYTNKAALTLEATRVSATPARPRAGQSFAVNLAVRRSDTGKGITSGTVTCRVLVSGKRVQAKGSVIGGAGRCSFALPPSASGMTVRGSITVRSSGRSVTADFSYIVV